MLRDLLEPLRSLRDTLSKVVNVYLIMSETECTLLVQAKHAPLGFTTHRIQFDPLSLGEVGSSNIWQSFVVGIQDQHPASTLLVHVLLDTSLVRQFMATPFKNTRSVADIKDAAAHRFGQLYGKGHLPDWELRGEWKSNGLFLVTAISKILLKQIEQLRLQSKIKLSAIQPLSIFILGNLQFETSEERWILLNDKFHAVLYIWKNAQLVSVRTCHKISILEDAKKCLSDPLMSMVLREAVQLELDAPKEVLLIGSPIETFNENSAVKWRVITDFPSNLTSVLNYLMVDRELGKHA